MSDLVGVVSDLTGRTITRSTVSDEEYLADLIAAGTPEEYARLALTFFTAGRRGEFATVDPALGEVPGRDPIPVRDVLAADLANGCGSGGHDATG